MSALSHRPPALALSRAASAVAVALTGLAAAFTALSAPTSGDFQLHGPVSGDNAGPALLALAHGRLGTFAQHQPLMGLASLLIRAPVVALSTGAGAGELTVYRLSALACLLPCALFAAWLIMRARASSAATASAGLAAAVILLSPATSHAVASGHPEEVLAATVMAAAMVASVRGRPGWAGVLMGIAIGTKSWAAIGVLPMLLTLDGARLRALSATAATALVLVAPPILADPHTFAEASRSFGDGHLVNAISAWWPVSSRPASLPAGAPLIAVLPWGLTKSTALVLGLGAGAAGLLGLWWMATARRTRLDAMALLVLMGVVRCLADSGPVEYYYLALLVPLAVWEAAILGRLPLVTLLAVAAVSLTFGPGLQLSATELNLVSLGWALALSVYLVGRRARVR